MSARRLRSQNKMSYYRLESIATVDPNGLPDKEALQSCGEFDITGKIEDHLIVSVSPSMSERSVTELLEKLGKVVEQPVVVVSHNVAFLRASKMSGKDAMKVAERVCDVQDETEDDPMNRGPVKVFGVKNAE